ncbi:MAG TPA: hypothetical protein VGQ73_06625 [Gemmatimonadales bacterium]|jgi:hypothetical protein|nr:hypothetical protein [Gemmatimonadales bacterium]
MSLCSPAGWALVKLMVETPRGPRREGVFALWLTLRVAEDVFLVPPPPERAMRRRVALLEQRLSSLMLPAPLRRALAAALSELREPRHEKAALVLQQLIAPARETLGPEAGDALGRAARVAAQQVKER